MTVLVCPSAQVETPFYGEWWFLLVMALSSLIVLLLVVFALVLHGQNKRYKNCGTGEASAPLPPPSLFSPISPGSVGPASPLRVIGTADFLREAAGCSAQVS